VDELSEGVFRHLVTEAKPMSFLPVPDEGSAEGDDSEGQILLFQPDDDETDEDGVAARHKDDKLQTLLTSERLQKRLLKLFYDARTYEEEQGVNILYLALGFLKWFEDQKSDRERFAPLLLIPVTIERQSAATRFKIRYTDDDISTNLSLQARLKDDFGIVLPDVPEIDELSPSDYYKAVSAAVQSQPRWEVFPNDMVLWFFSFSKFLMYRDLQPENWPEHEKLEEHRLIQAILGDGFGDEPPLCGDDDKIDEVIRPIDMIHVMDADSSQALAVEETRRGRSLVIQGPPGTGKSQTIANMIAAAVKAGKSVLFVAEKMAALEVVRRRLGNIGLGDMCLELHSNKANRRAVLQDLERTLGLGQPQVQDVQRHSAELETCRQRLNVHLQIIHSPIEPAGVTPYQVVGELVRLRASTTTPPDLRLANPLQWSRAQFQARLGLLRDLVEHLVLIGVPHQHPWRGVELDAVLPSDVDRMKLRLPGIMARLGRLCDAGSQLAGMLGMSAPGNAVELSQLARLAQRLAAAPPMDRQSLASPAWTERRQHIEKLVQTESREAKIDPQFRQVYSRLPSMPDVQPILRQIGGDLKPALAELKDLFASLRLNLQSAFGVPELAAIPLSGLSSRLPQWQAQPEALSRWVPAAGDRAGSRPTPS